MLSWVKKNNINDGCLEFLEKNGALEWEISKEKAFEIGKKCWDEKGRLKSVKEIRNVLRDGGTLGSEFLNRKNAFEYMSVDEINDIFKNLPDGYLLYGHVILANRGLETLPDFSKVEVSGLFTCANNLLKSLEGSPKIARLYFYCHNNKLKNLKGSPQKECGNFDCSDNELESLEGAPKEIGATFYCNNNKLKNLVGAPKTIYKSFIVNDNELETLEGAPDSVGLNFVCKGNKLVSLKGKPREIGGEFVIEDEELQRLEKVEEVENKKKDKVFWNKIIVGLSR